MARTTHVSDGIDRTATDADRPLTTAEVAQMIGVSPLGLADLRRRGGGPPYYRPGRRYVRYRLADVRAWIAARTVGKRES